MRNNMNRSLLFVYVLSVTLILIVTAGILAEATKSEPYTKESVPRLSSFAGQAQAPDKTAPQPAQAAAVLKKQVEPLEVAALSAVTAASSEQSVVKVLNAQADPPSASFKPYAVTAFYLNVRSQANANSDIIKVVEQGTILEVAGTAGNGWLKLAGEGYVNGDYVQPLSANGKDAARVTVLSARAPAAPIKAVKPKPAVVIHKLGKIAKPTSTVKSKSGLTERHIAELFAGTALAGQGLEQAILEIEGEYGVNAYFTIAVMKLESGNGKSRLARSKNNLFGLMARNGPLSFETKEDSVRKFGQLISKNYVGKGYSTIEKVGKKYTPVNPRWPALVKMIMKSDYRKL